MEMLVQKAHSPWHSLFILIGLSLICSFIFQFLAIVIAMAFFGNMESFSTVKVLIPGSEATSSPFIYVLLLAGSIGTFFLPALILQTIERRFVAYFPVSKGPQSIYYLLSFLLLVAFNPVLGLVSEWNQGVSLPESMSGVEDWMREKEEQMALLTQHLVMTSSVEKLVLNVFVFAVVPAICEEFFFRGGVQGIAKRMLKNDHAAIWATAIIFSAIHFQFYGFFPRVFLGAMFGYMMVWTQNIWVPIFAHFVNNASVTIIAFIFASKGKSYEDMMNSGGSYPMSLYILSLMGSVLIGYYFYRKRLTNEQKEAWKMVG